MPSKNFILDGDLAVTIYKRKTSRNLRLSIAPGGKIRVSIPAWASYSAGLNFARSQQVWIRDQHNPTKLLINGQAIGKAHHLRFVRSAAATKTSSRVYDTTIAVNYPFTNEPDSLEVQMVAQEACIRALRAQAEQLLPGRLAALAKANNFAYASVRIKRLKSRWGSCDQHAHIVLNLFLMQLPWQLIDYVLLHELTHTVVLRHGPDFWQSLEAVLPDVAGLRKSIRDYQPILNSIN